MIGSERISIRAFTILTFFFMIGTSILIAPNGLALAAKQDAWLAAIAGIAINLILVWLYAVLGERHSGQTLVEYSQTLLGKWAGKLVGLLFTLFCYLLAALMLGDMGYFMTSQIMTETPIEALQILFVICIVLVVRQGFTGYSRASEILFIWVVLLLVLFTAPLLPIFDSGRLRPVLEFGLMPILDGGSHFFAFQEMAVLLMVYPFVVSSKGRKNAFAIGTALGGLVLILTTLGSIGVLGEALTANNLYPVYTLAKNIKFGRFIERIEGLMIFIWVCSIFLKITLVFHSSIIGFSQVTGIGDRRVFLWPLAIGMIVLSLACYTNIIYVEYFLITYWSAFATVFLVAVPALLLLVSLIRKKKAS
ncbi:endospore germination permease [Paenibacillus sepulcri]|uniref:Spore germination protein n=1 Tax=Paenibacillus sepulcri TaxID=359917 RepID=A0ABS7C5E9_9BACL|nr:spore germination protein [Paenibacillus sepulcri]